MFKLINTKLNQKFYSGVCGAFFAQMTLAILVATPSFTAAAGIDDITSYEGKVNEIKELSVSPYTTEEIIALIPKTLNEQLVYKNNHYFFDLDDKRAKAFDIENFKSCDDLYITGYGNYGGGALGNTLRFLFPEDEKSKKGASLGLKHQMSYIENSNNLKYRDNRCDNKIKSVAKLKELLNAIVQSAPAIIKEKERLIEVAKQDVANKKQQLELENSKKEKAEAERNAAVAANETAEKRGREERQLRLKACESKTDYKLHVITRNIQYNREIANGATRAIEAERAAGEISGVVDKNKLHKLGNKALGAKLENEENFRIYKNLGGKESSVDNIRQTKNPCDNI